MMHERGVQLLIVVAIGVTAIIMLLTLHGRAMAKLRNEMRGFQRDTQDQRE